MSVSPPQPPRTNPRDYRIYLCYNCNRMVWLAPTNPSEIICPRCFSEFLLELEETPQPRLVLDLTHIDPSPEDRILEALTLMVDPRRNRGISGRTRSRLRSGQRPDPRTGPFPWIIFQPYDPTRAPPAPTENQPNAPTVDPRNYFAGPGWDQLINEITENDRPGPPPASSSAIDAMPTVKITQEHLVNDDSHCPVCKEEFKVGGEVREMPCKHLYHSECIVPWLRIHNSCPVCRHELPGFLSGDEQESEVDRAFRNRGSRLWNRVTRLWSTGWRWWRRYRQIRPHDDSITATPSANSWWRSWFQC